MSFDINWLKEGHVFLVTANENLGNEHAPEFNDAIYNYFEESSRVLVHGIFDFSRTTNFFSLKSMAQFTFPRHQRMGWNLFVGLPNKHIVFLISMATQIFKVRARNFDTVEEAMTFVKWVDQTVEDGTFVLEESL